MFGSEYAGRLKRKQGQLGDSWYLDEMFVKIRGQQFYLWRAVDQERDTIDILVQPRRDCRAAKRFFLKLLKGPGTRGAPLRLVSDDLRSLPRRAFITALRNRVSYSSCSTIFGATRPARHAGSHAAAIPTAASIAGTVRKVSGSAGEMP